MPRLRASGMPRASGSSSTQTTGMSSSRSRARTRVPILPSPSRTTWPDRPRGGRRSAPRGAEGAQCFQGSGDEEREQGQADEAGQQLEDLVGDRRVERGVVDGEQVEQCDVGGVHGVGVGEHGGREGQTQHGGSDTGQRPPQTAGEELAQRGPATGQAPRSQGGAGVPDGLEYDTSSPAAGRHGPVVGQEEGSLRAAGLRALGACRVGGGGREQCESAQAGVRYLAASGRGAFGGAQEDAVGLYDLARPGDGGSGERGGRGVRVGQDRGGGVQDAPVDAGGVYEGGLVEQFLQVLPELPVVHTDHESQPGAEAAGGDRGAQVRLVVLVEQGEGSGPIHTGPQQRLLAGRRCHDVPQRRRRAAGHLFGDGTAGPPEQLRGTGQHGGLFARQFLVQVSWSDEDDPLSVDVPQLGGEPVRESVVAADHHVAAVPWISGVLVR